MLLPSAVWMQLISHRPLLQQDLLKVCRVDRPISEPRATAKAKTEMTAQPEPIPSLDATMWQTCDTARGTIAIASAQPDKYTGRRGTRLSGSPRDALQLQCEDTDICKQHDAMQHTARRGTDNNSSETPILWTALQAETLMIETFIPKTEVSSDCDSINHKGDKHSVCCPVAPYMQCADSCMPHLAQFLKQVRESVYSKLFLQQLLQKHNQSRGLCPRTPFLRLSSAAAAHVAAAC